MNDIASPQLAAILKTPPKVERIRIASREQWLSARRQDVTASAAAALLGIHPYATAYGLWATKTGRISDEIEETPPMRRGKLLEPLAVQILRDEYPDWTFSDHPVGLYFRDPSVRLGATPDLNARDPQGRMWNIQLKSVEASVFNRDWHDAEGNVSPPLWIVIQSIIETHLTGFECAAVAPLVVGHGVELPFVPVPLHEGIIERIKVEVSAFWRMVDDGRTPDPDYGKDGALLERLFAPTGEIMDLSQDNQAPDLVDERERLAAEKSVIEKRQKAIKAELLHKLANASAGRLSDGRLITAKRIDRAGYTVDPTSYIDVRTKKAQGAHR